MNAPPKKIPPELLAAFTMGGAIQVDDWYFDDTTRPDEPTFYSRQQVESLIGKARTRQTNYYGKTDEWLYHSLEKHPIRGQNVVILGSTQPWYEAICTVYGARCTTIEFNPIASDYPGLKFLTPEQFARSPQQFDAALSISTFEHTGLGRYGDPLNPTGDLMAMKQMKEIVKKDGLLYLAVPVGRDKLVWNAHRIYGRKRLPLLMEGWEVVAKFGFSYWRVWRNVAKEDGYQPIWVLRNL